MTWYQSSFGKWILKDKNGEQHRCSDDKFKAVTCKYCNADDLHWGADPDPDKTKMVLTESYGLPHACDARIAFVAKEKQDKKDRYEGEKLRIAATPDGACQACKGTGGISSIGYGLCTVCVGHGYFTLRNRKNMLATLRQKIWPHMPETPYYKTRRY